MPCGRTQIESSIAVFYRRFAFYALLLVLLLNLISCAPRYSTSAQDPAESFQLLSVSALTSNEPREETAQLLRLLFLDRENEDNPRRVIAAFEHNAASHESITALSELAYLHAKRIERSDPKEAGLYYVMSAWHSYFLLSSNESNLDTLSSREEIFLTMLYNSSVSRLVSLWQSEGAPWDKTFSLQTEEASYDLHVDSSKPGLWNPNYFSELQPAFETNVSGLRNHYRVDGLGAPYSGIKKNHPKLPNWERHYPSPIIVQPMTAVLEFDTPDSNSKSRSATLKFYDPRIVETMNLGKRRFPLEADYSAAFGALLSKVDTRRFEFDALLHPTANLKRVGIFMVEPYRPNKIPVLMTHGLYSSPASFIEMFNDLNGVKTLRDRYQFWFFQYPTGLPIIYTASLLRKEILKMREEFDPNRNSKAFDQMVLVGHSMGGLLTRLMVERSGNTIWNALFNAPPESFNLSQEEHSLVDSIFFFEPIPFIKRVIFIATPHHGSEIATWWIVRQFMGLITLPFELVEGFGKIIARQKLSGPSLSNEDERQKDNIDELLPSSIGQLSPNSKFLQAMSNLSINAPYHSIIGIQSSKTAPNSTDGIVPYESSHFDGAQSEILVPAPHSCLEHPLSILEIKRILLLHIQ